MYNAKSLLSLEFKLPLRREPLIVAYASGGADSGVTDLIEACAILHRRHCVFRCEIYGAEAHASQIRELINKAGLIANVKYLTTPARMREAVARASVFSAVGDATHTDSSALSQELFALFEAMALGTPCLVTDYSTGAELICDGESGVVEPRNYPMALAISMQRLLSDASLRIRLAIEARQCINEKFDIGNAVITAHGANPHHCLSKDEMLQPS
jgi:colanic acid/amylovoran biosynthesis glycosyltransferase